MDPDERIELRFMGEHTAESPLWGPDGDIGLDELGLPQPLVDDLAAWADTWETWASEDLYRREELWHDFAPLTAAAVELAHRIVAEYGSRITVRLVGTEEIVEGVGQPASPAAAAAVDRYFAERDANCALLAYAKANPGRLGWSAHAPLSSETFVPPAVESPGDESPTPNPAAT